MNIVVEQRLMSKLSVRSPQRVAEVENFVEFLAAKSRKRQALDRLLAVAPAIEAANTAAGSSGLTEAEIEAEIKAEVMAIRRRGATDATSDHTRQTAADRR